MSKWQKKSDAGGGGLCDWLYVVYMYTKRTGVKQVLLLYVVFVSVSENLGV